MTDNPNPFPAPEPAPAQPPTADTLAAGQPSAAGALAGLPPAGAAQAGALPPGGEPAAEPPAAEAVAGQAAAVDAPAPGLPSAAGALAGPPSAGGAADAEPTTAVLPTADAATVAEAPVEQPPTAEAAGGPWAAPLDGAVPAGGTDPLAGPFGGDPWAAPDVVAQGTADPARRRRVRRAVARWTAAVLVFAALGGASAYAVTLPERTDIPGLRTPDDGRWTYPRLSLPRLPEGAPRASDSDHNPAGRHYADLRALLLPAPRGAKRDTAFPGRNGWLPTSRFVNQYQPGDRSDLRARLVQQGLRHIAATAWTAPDGTRVEIYLAQFLSRPYASDVATGALGTAHLTQAPASSVDMSYRAGGVPAGVAPYAYDEDKPRGTTHVRYAVLLSGDTVGLVVMSAPSAKGGPPAVPFHQTVTLQAQLLG